MPWFRRTRRFAAILLSLIVSVFSETEVCGTLSLAQEWTAQGSPYRVTGNIFVPETSQLRIGPGVEVIFAAPGKACGETDSTHHSAAEEHSLLSITVEGSFYCIGEPRKPVVFRPQTSSTVGWEGLRLSGQAAASAEIAFVEFHGANRAVRAERAGFTLHHALFENNNVGLWLASRGNLTVLHCDFIRNRIAGIRMEQAEPRVVNNIFYRNPGYGIWMGDGGNVALTYNAFSGNGEENCFRCPYAVLRPARVNANGDSTDVFFNLPADPIFLGSESDQAAQRKDPTLDTPEHLVRDPELAHLEKKSRLQFWKRSAREPAPFKPRGVGPYVLSRYSKLIRAGHPGKSLRNPDGTPGDIGLHGGPATRITENPF